MRTLPLTILCLLTAFFSACRGGEEGNKQSAPSVTSRVRLITDDGRTIEKSLENESSLESLRQIVGTVNGRFVLTITTKRTNDTFDQELEGRLADGILNGPVRTYLVVDNKRQLVSEETYSSDMRQGPFVSYYPKSGQVQTRANFDTGAKNGEFSSYYPNGNRAVRMHYDHDQLEGVCEIYDNRGELIAAGTYQKGVPVTGTFVEDLRSFIMESIDNRPITVRIATVNEAKESTEVVERTINPK